MSSSLQQLTTLNQRFFLYARKSTDVEDKQVLSIEAQLAELREFAKKESINIVEEFIEKQSAKIPGRPVFNNMLARLEKGQAQGIISWHPDRLARNSVDGGKVIYLIDTGKISALKFNTFWFEPTPQGKFMLNIAFGQSKYYVDSLSENTKRGLRQKVRRGEMPGVAPTGYINDSRNKTISLDKRVAPVIIQAFEMYSQGNKRIIDIINFLSTNKITNRKGKALHYDRVKNILKNPFYYGHFKYNGEIFEGRHEAIISKKLFDTVQTVLHTRNHQWQDAKVERVVKPYLGLLKCGECGMMITAENKVKHYKNGTSQEFKYYRCTRKSKVHKCFQPFAREENIDEQISQLIKKHSLKSDWAKTMFKRLDTEEKGISQSVKTVLALKENEVKTINIKLQFLLDSYLDQTIDKESYLTKKEELTSKKKTIEEQIQETKTNQGSWLGPMREWITEAKNASKVAASTDLEAKRTLAVKIFGSDLTLEDKKVRGIGQNVWSALCAAPTARELERDTGIKPVYSDWQPDALSLC